MLRVVLQPDAKPPRPVFSIAATNYHPREYHRSIHVGESLYAWRVPCRVLALEVSHNAALHMHSDRIGIVRVRWLTNERGMDGLPDALAWYRSAELPESCLIVRFANNFEVFITTEVDIRLLLRFRPLKAS